MPQQLQHSDIRPDAGVGDGASSDATAAGLSVGDEAGAASGVPQPLAALLAAGALVVPYMLSRSTSPSPDHPRVFLWYRLLRKPAFQPPDLAFPLAWTAIESGLAVGAYRLLRAPATPDRSRALALLAGNVLAIGGWSRMFFGRRNLPASTVAAAAMIGSSAAYVASARRADPVSAVAGVPFALWVGFATVLTAAIWRRNR